ncbi:phospho-sugar mutase [Frondihabitans sp. PAMC 28766]|uniref:phospho-sugar mutase n=1 Tax=Frondihabitans sp. PAMC 28766 TaxID=1795630 RepID=UPI001EF656E8|nr:phospho-sugar mutase [Frondihabitans sp. PAMC 28766]
MAAQAWLAQDPDAETRAELSALVDAAATGDSAAAASLADRFDGRLEFGTAGLRGEIGAGSKRMNRVLVAQAAAGLAAYLLARKAAPSIVIGYDGRTKSDVFARDTAEIMAAAGVATTLLPRALPTPVLAFAVRHFDASAGVMVTASHNPPRDNGYKVYLGDDDQGSQIVSPADADIAALIEVAAHSSVLDLPRSDAYTTAGDDLVTDYVRLTAAVAGSAAADAASAGVAQPRVVYTALHGVGWEVARRVFATAGFTEPIPVADQAAPDATFPTVAFPNPEEPGAMDLSFETAARVGADLVIANDPDADRLAVAIPVGDPSDPAAWRRLTGNEVGALLGWRAAERQRAEGTRGTLAASIVSSPALGEVARHFDLPSADTLTGFKWVSRVDGLAYGYEEALGYLVDPAKVRDKDGISAAVDFLALVVSLRIEGTSLEQHLRDFDERFGAFASTQVSLRVTDLADIGRITSSLRATPPAAIGGQTVAAVDDFAAGVDGFAPTDILRFRFGGGAAAGGAAAGGADATSGGAGAGGAGADGARVIVRPSGTEPKLKVYIDAWSSTGTAAERRAAADAAVAALEAGVRELLR